jgi:hypothetical protein
MRVLVLVANLQECGCLLGGFGVFPVFYPFPRILGNGSLVATLQGGALSAPPFVFEKEKKGNAARMYAGQKRGGRNEPRPL